MKRPIGRPPRRRAFTKALAEIEGMVVPEVKDIAEIIRQGLYWDTVGDQLTRIATNIHAMLKERVKK